MKKTTLFTTLALVVIVAIALSTATFAWYSASSKAQLNTATLTAETVSSAELAIGTTSTATTTNIDLGDDTLDPAMPTAEISATAANFFTVNQNKDGIVTSYSSDSVQVLSKEFYLINNGSQATSAIKMTVSIETVTDSSVTDGMVKWVLLDMTNSKVLANSLYNYYDGTITTYTTQASALVSADKSVAALKNAAASEILTSIDANSNVQMKLIVWLDGPSVTDTESAKTIQVGVSFSA